MSTMAGPLRDTTNSIARSQLPPKAGGEADGAGGAVVPSSLPHKEYFGASKLGEGAFGAVVLVYDEDGTEWAAKIFEADDDDDDDDEIEYDSDGDEIETESWSGGTGLPVEVVRELSMLRLLNGAHPNIMRMADASMIEYEGVPMFSMVMPKAAGSLSGAITSKSLSGSAKVKVAALLLDALDWMASQDIMHRDIKPDNILIDDGNSPTICDFSLAKVVYPVQKSQDGAGKKVSKKQKKRFKRQSVEPGQLNSEGCGTPTYIAPEIVNGATDYGTKVDVWSMGVVFYEMFNNEMLTVNSDKKALALIEQVKTKLGAKPLPTMLRKMLDVDPASRLSAKEALAILPNASKVKLSTPGRILDLAAIDASIIPPSKKKAAKGELTTTRACEILDHVHPMTPKAADFFWRRSSVAREHGNEGAACCAMLAFKEYEAEPQHAESIWIGFSGFGDYDGEVYAEMELKILKDLDYCLGCPC